MGKRWKMPNWMKGFAPYITNTGGNGIEELYNDKSLVQVNAPRALLSACIQAQVALLYRLYDARELRSEQRHTFYLGVSHDSHRDAIYHLFPTEGTALKWAAAEVRELAGVRRTTADKLNVGMRLAGWKFYTTIGDDLSVSVHAVKLNAVRL